MGWTTLNREKGQSHQEFFQREFGDYVTILDTYTRGGVVYAALQEKASESVFAVVILTQWAPKSYYNFGYKDMDESMGPCERRCPDRILNLLTPTESKWAQEWRADCRAYNASVR